MNVLPATQVEVHCLCESSHEAALIEEQSAAISDLGKVSRLHVGPAGEICKPPMAAGALAGKVEIYVVLEGVLDFESESKRLQKEIAKVEKEFAVTLKKLSNEDFLAKAPGEIIGKEREKSARLGEKMEKLKSHFQIIDDLRQKAKVGG
jgi:valyl-tRNA synthetase